MATGTAFINPIPIGNSTAGNSTGWGYAQATTYSGTQGIIPLYPKCGDGSCTACYPSGTTDGIADYQKDKVIALRNHQIALLSREIKRLRDKERDISEVFLEVEMMKDTCKNCKALIKLKK